MIIQLNITPKSIPYARLEQALCLLCGQVNGSLLFDGIKDLALEEGYTLHDILCSTDTWELPTRLKGWLIRLRLEYKNRQTADIDRKISTLEAFNILMPSLILLDKYLPDDIKEKELPYTFPHRLLQILAGNGCHWVKDIIRQQFIILLPNLKIGHRSLHDLVLFYWTLINSLPTVNVENEPSSNIEELQESAREHFLNIELDLIHDEFKHNLLNRLALNNIRTMRDFMETPLDIYKNMHRIGPKKLLYIKEYKAKFEKRAHRLLSLYNSRKGLL